MNEITATQNHKVFKVEWCQPKGADNSKRENVSVSGFHDRKMWSK